MVEDAYEELRKFLLTDHKPRLKPTTVDDTLRKVRHLEKCGLRLERFLTTPDEARRNVRDVLAYKASTPGRRGRVGAGLRGHQIVLNRVAQWAASLDITFTGLKWDLAPEERSEGKNYTPSQVATLKRYRHPDRYTSARHRAIIWFARYTRLRRQEISLARTFDIKPHYHPDFDAFWVEHPAKGGPQRHIPLHPDVRRPNYPVQGWLRARKPDPRNPNALWTVKGRDGRVRAMNVRDMTVDLQRISKRVGFRVSFVRFRRYGTTELADAGMHPTRLMQLTGHAKLKSLEHYLAKATPEQTAAELARCGVPGFSAATRRRRAQSGSR